MVLNPALMLHRRVHQNLPMPAMLEVVRHNRDFELAVAFFKMGYPLKICMQGVPWPQNRYEPPDGCFPPCPPKIEACQVCDKAISSCKCLAIFKDSIIEPMRFEGYEDYLGYCWPYHSFSIEDALGGVMVLVESWSNETQELSIAKTIGTGIFWGSQVVRARSERLLNWMPIDGQCECPLRGFHEHDAWEPCTRVERDEDVYLIQTSFFIDQLM